jgi:hypothetical protein
LAAFEDLLVAAERPLVLKKSIAFSKSPFAAMSASLQSIIPAPVFVLNSFTIVEVISNVIPS